MLSWIFRSNSKTPALPKDFRKLVDSDALQIVDQLQKAGFETYLVGGCVRDVLLRKHPKDFDIATKATPQQVKAVVRRSFIIGKRFRIVVAKRRPRASEQAHASRWMTNTREPHAEKEFQITTFRRDPVVVNGLVNENVFGTPKEDALRRDFTLNALFLDPTHGKIVDFVGGLPDLGKRILRVIGDPAERFREDPIRILRALRFQVRAHLKLDPASAKALRAAIPLLGAAKKERVREELLKSLKEGAADEMFKNFSELGLWHQINPALEKAYGPTTTVAHKTLLKIGAALSEDPWPHQRLAAPLFFLLLYDFLSPFKRGGLNSEDLEKLLDDLKVSRAERDDIHRIRGSLLKMARPDSKAGKHDMRHSINALYVAKILAEAKVAPFENADWARKFSAKDAPAQHGHGHSHAPRGAHHGHGASASTSATTAASTTASAAPRRRRRRRGGRGASSAGVAGGGSDGT